jgi:hypothetical protein
MSVPQAFRDAVERAARAGRPGDLRLLSWEIHDLPWATDGQFLAASVKIAIEHEPAKGRVLLFAGHQPSFKAEHEEKARQAISEAILADRQEFGPAKLGLAGAAGGGDILFHEICAELGVPSQVYLPFSRQSYLDAAVRPAGAFWEGRFERLLARGPVFQLGESPALPTWLEGKQGYDVWTRNNRWLLHNAFAEGHEEVAVIAFWNPEDGDAPGSSGDLVKEALERGATPRLLDSRGLFRA